MLRLHDPDVLRRVFHASGPLLLLLGALLLLVTFASAVCNFTSPHLLDVRSTSLINNSPRTIPTRLCHYLNQATGTRATYSRGLATRITARQSLSSTPDRSHLVLGGEYLRTTICCVSCSLPRCVSPSPPAREVRLHFCSRSTMLSFHGAGAPVLCTTL